LPEALVTGAAPHSAACSALSTRSRIGPTSASKLSQVDGARTGQRGQQLGAWMAGDTLGERHLELSDGHQQGAQQLDLGADKGRQGAGGMPAGQSGPSAAGPGALPVACRRGSCADGKS
jgi:hypothetical protein